VHVRQRLFALVVGIQQLQLRQLPVVQPREAGYPLLRGQFELRGDQMITTIRPGGAEIRKPYVNSQMRLRQRVPCIRGSDHR
jgi:hypothetical protein